ncbi:unnamed protein product [Cunninghamella blakesleeana]
MYKFLYSVAISQLKQFNNLQKVSISNLSVILSNMVNTVDYNNRALLRSVMSNNEINNIISNEKAKYMNNDDNDEELNECLSDMKKVYYNDDIYESDINIKSSKVDIILDIYNHILNMVEDSKWNGDGLLVLGMDAIGLIGYMYSISLYEDAVVAVKLNDENIFLPSELDDLSDFMETNVLLKFLFIYKEHIVQLSKIIQS